MKFIEKVIKGQKTWVGRNPEQGQMRGLWSVYSLPTPVVAPGYEAQADAAIGQRLVKGLEHYYAGRSALKFPSDITPELENRKNLVVDGLIGSVVDRMVGVNTPTQDLLMRKIAVGNSNLVVASGNAQLALEKFRANPTSLFKDGNNKAIIVLFVDRLTGNGHETLIVADAGNTTTSFKVTPGSAVNFNIGDRIRVTTTSQFNFVDILNIDIINDIITVTPALADLPLPGQQVIQAWAEAGVFGNSNTGNIANTGTLFNRVNGLNFVKDNSKIVLIEVQFILTAV